MELTGWDRQVPFARQVILVRVLAKEFCEYCGLLVRPLESLNIVVGAETCSVAQNQVIDRLWGAADGDLVAVELIGDEDLTVCRLPAGGCCDEHGAVGGTCCGQHSIFTDRRKGCAGAVEAGDGPGHGGH